MEKTLKTQHYKNIIVSIESKYNTYFGIYWRLYKKKICNKIKYSNYNKKKIMIAVYEYTA